MAADRLSSPSPRYWPLVLAATATLLVTMGIRQSMGLFVDPIVRDTGLGIAQLSLALAIGQLVWGLVQPVFGAVADQQGPGRVLVLGGVLLVGGLALATLPLAWPLRRRASIDAATIASAAPAGPTLREQLRTAARDRSYWCLHIGFFTCGVHIAFLVTHLPTQIALCGLSPTVSSTSLALIGLFNVAGSLAIGWLGQHVRMKLLLAVMYASRAALIVGFLLAPPTPLTFYVFAAGLGVTWLATVPPTAGLVGKLFGPRYLGTLFGLTLLSHQVGGFFGAWVGGLVIERFGDYTWMWYADIALALLAAVANLPIREARPALRAATASA